MAKRSAVNDVELPCAKKQTTEQKDEDFIKSGRLLETGEFSDVEVIVGQGPEARKFKLHKAILVQNSGYFRRALKSDAFLEGRNSKIRLPNHSTATFSHVLHWLYHGKQRSSNFPLNIFSHVTRISYATYFDIPSLLRETIKDLQEEILKEGLRASYQPGGKSAGTFVEGITQLLELYPTQAKALDSIIYAICKTGYLERIMTDNTLRPLLQEEPEILGRIIEIQLGLGKKYDDQRVQTEQMDLLKELALIDSL